MRVDGELFAAAKATGADTGRNAAQQIAHWARIGRELESSPHISLHDIQRVLAGEPGASYDDLSELDQAIVRVDWDEQVNKRLASLNFEKEFTK